jgi:type IV secretion system protein VirB8
VAAAFIQPEPSDGCGDDAAFERNRAWELDRALLLERSERRGWLVGIAGTALALLGVLAVFAQGPLRQVVGVPIVVDRTTGETTIQQRLAAETVPPQEALDKHNCAVFVRAREGYSWWWLQRDFDQVARMAVPVVFGDYNRQFDGEAALQKRVAAAEEWRINVVAVRLSPGGRRGNLGDAIVTYDKVVRLTERNLPEVTTRHVASIVFEYQPKAFSKERDRLENPFGFVVTAYRSDPEINTPAKPAAVAPVVSAAAVSMAGPQTPGTAAAAIPVTPVSAAP